MEKVVSRIEGEVDMSRFLTSQSLLLLRRAVQEVASQVAEQAQLEFGGNTQVDRDRRYVYAFFGRDFVDSLYAMNSEFLFTGNRILGLNSMDNISLNRALFVAALAKNDVRVRIFERFLSLIKCDLPQAEWDYRMTTRLKPCKSDTIQEIYARACNLYHFRSLRGVFAADIGGPDTLNPMQQKFIQLAQIFKSQMLAEVELRQRIDERGLVQDRANDEDDEFEVLKEVQAKFRQGIQDQLLKLAEVDSKGDDARAALKEGIDQIYDASEAKILKEEVAREYKRSLMLGLNRDKNVQVQFVNEVVLPKLQEARRQWELLSNVPGLDKENKYFKEGTDSFGKLSSLRSPVDKANASLDDYVEASKSVFSTLEQVIIAYEKLRDTLNIKFVAFEKLSDRLVDEVPRAVGDVLAKRDTRTAIVVIFNQWDKSFRELRAAIIQAVPTTSDPNAILAKLEVVRASVGSGYRSIGNLRRRAEFKRATRSPLDNRKMLDSLIDKQEEKYIELVEGTRSYIAALDDYLKRLTIAIEDDCKAQFYDPAFANVRKASREYDVSLGQVERTTILTNNRAFAKVSPQATMEFDLPKRDILIAEGMKGAKALVQDYGQLLQDPTFLAATQLFSGQPTSMGVTTGRPGVAGAPNLGIAQPFVKDVLPTLPSQSEQQILNQTGNQRRELGSALEALIPDPAIYKFETGTGFEIKPVIQPDGDSIVYDFNYMYTTNVREPVRPDEKHLGRVKRHFIDTQVQTGTHELREISRYQVALKAARTSRGVPLFEDIPGVGVLFRPLPSAESSLQQNIILGQSTVYSTVFDLMGLRWAPQVVDMDDARLVEAEHVDRGRRTIIENHVLGNTSERVDDFLGVAPQNIRPDLRTIPARPSPYHPNGYIQPNVSGDPTGEADRVQDPRPYEYRQPYTAPSGRLDRRPESDGGTPTPLPPLPGDFSVTAPIEHGHAPATVAPGTAPATIAPAPEAPTISSPRAPAEPLPPPTDGGSPFRRAGYPGDRRTPEGQGRLSGRSASDLAPLGAPPSLPGSRIDPSLQRTATSSLPLPKSFAPAPSSPDPKRRGFFDRLRTRSSN